MEKKINTEEVGTSQLVDPRNARAEGYRETMEEIVSSQSCPLCPPMRWHPKPILKDNGLWIITENSHPYPNSRYHFLLVHKKHIEKLDDLRPPDLISFFELVNWTNQKFDIKGGGLTMRFGDTLYTGATIKHLHGHLIVPMVEGDQVSPVWFPIG